MDSKKIKTILPWTALSFLFVLAVLSHGVCPRFFFPAFDGRWVLSLGTLGMAAFGALAFQKNHGLNRRRRAASRLIRSLAEKRSPLEDPSENDVILAGRVVSRLPRNADEDLREIDPDFSLASLDRLVRYLPLLLDEVESEEDALIRWGVVGTYMGETLCRQTGWNWFFKPDPALRQFSFLSSVLRRGPGRELDPYAWAVDLFDHRRGLNGLLDEVK
jgi:hypothetical protein